MERITATDGGFHVETSVGTLHTGAILLAIGRRGSPRKLAVPGEELPKVVYRLVEAEQYRGKRVLVVGGGDSAIEAALACAKEPGTNVTLVYRGEAFNRVKASNRLSIETARTERRVDVRFMTEVRRILADSVELVVDGAPVTVGNDVVIVQAGGVLPTALLRELGVTVQTMYGTA
jgi:thioredoxin reductase